MYVPVGGVSASVFYATRKRTIKSKIKILTVGVCERKKEKVIKVL